MVQSLRETDLGQELAGMRDLALLSRQALSELDILESIEKRNQRGALKHHPHALRAEPRACTLVQPADVRSFEDDLARAGQAQSCQEREHRRFAPARRADEAGHLPARKPEVGAPQSHGFCRTFAIDLENVAQARERFSGCDGTLFYCHWKVVAMSSAPWGSYWFETIPYA